jgi:hypothetical protein
MTDSSDSRYRPDADFEDIEVSIPNQSDMLGPGKGEEILDLTDVVITAPDVKTEERVEPAAFPADAPLENAITPEVLERALERVITRMFSEKIEPLMVEAVERGVQKEIERLRALLLEDAPDVRKL